MEQTDKQFAELIDHLRSLLTSAEGHLPDIAQQMLAFGHISALILLVVSLPVLLIAAWCGFKALTDYDAVGCAFISLIFMIIGFLLAGIGAESYYKVKYAPKLYLLDQAAGYVKSCK